MKVKGFLVISVAVLHLCSGFGHGAAMFIVTEVYSGVTGPDGTDDWFELTNVGDMSGDTSTLYYDDIAPDPTRADQLSALTLSPGESAVFLISGNFGVDAIQFRDVWGPGALLGFVDGPALTGTDEINLFGSNTAGATLLTSLSFSGDHDVTRATHIFDEAGNQSTAIAGVDGAYESLEFFNDSLGDPDNMITLVGSPGVVIPEPGTAFLLLLAAGGFLVVPRRRLQGTH